MGNIILTEPSTGHYESYNFWPQTVYKSLQPNKKVTDNTPLTSSVRAIKGDMILFWTSVFFFTKVFCKQPPLANLTHKKLPVFNVAPPSGFSWYVRGTTSIFGSGVLFEGPDLFFGMERLKETATTTNRPTKTQRNNLLPAEFFSTR